MDRRAQYDQQPPPGRKTRKSSSQTRHPPERSHKETAHPAPHGKSQQQQQDAGRKVNFKHEGFQSQDEMFKYLEETKSQLEKEIHKRLVEQLILKAQGQINTPEQQESLERLYLDLKMINPELAIATLKASAEITSKLNQSAPPPQQSHQQQIHQTHSQPPHHPHQQKQSHHHQMQQQQQLHSSQQQQQQLHRQHSERSSKNPDKTSNLSKTSSGHQALRQRSKSRSKKSSAR
jgi:hypothetical protein